MMTSGWTGETTVRDLRGWHVHHAGVDVVRTNESCVTEGPGISGDLVSNFAMRILAQPTQHVNSEFGSSRMATSFWQWNISCRRESGQKL